MGSVENARFTFLHQASICIGHDSWVQRWWLYRVFI